MNVTHLNTANFQSNSKVPGSHMVGFKFNLSLTNKTYVGLGCKKHRPGLRWRLQLAVVFNTGQAFQWIDK